MRAPWRGLRLGRWAQLREAAGKFLEWVQAGEDSD